MEQNNDEKMWAGFSYLGLMCCMIPTIVIFLLKKDESQMIKFASLQAIALWLISFIIGIIFYFLGNIPVLGFVFGMVHMVLMLGFMGYWIYLMVMTFQGNEVEIPFVGEFIRTNLM